MVKSGIGIFLRVLIYTAMVGLICIFFAGNGEFIYEGF